jgi:hypothetical protein
MNKKSLGRKKQISKKLLKQALFGENGCTQLTALILLSQNADPEMGWLLETVLKSDRIFKLRSGRK